MGNIISSFIWIIILVVWLFWWTPEYFRYQTRQNAQNELAAQQYLKQVSIAVAEAKNESAKYEAEAEVTRAEWVAKANKIIWESLNHNESYLKYLWINNMSWTNKEVIYIPTEASLPILESTRLLTK